MFPCLGFRTDRYVPILSLSPSMHTRNNKKGIKRNREITYGQEKKNAEMRCNLDLSLQTKKQEG